MINSDERVSHTVKGLEVEWDQESSLERHLNRVLEATSPVSRHHFCTQLWRFEIGRGMRI